MARTSGERVSVLIAESNSVYCQLFASALANSPYHIQVVAWAVATAGVLDAIHQFEPDVALIASQLQDGTDEGFQALAGIRKLQTKTRVVMLLNSADDAQVIDAFRGGARGVFLRSSSIEHLPKCIWSVCRGQVWAGSRELELVLEILARALPLRFGNSQRAPILTKREEQVVRLVAGGLTNREISSELSLSAHTVKNYIFRLYDKLGISNRVELAAYSTGQGWPPGVSGISVRESE
jgi:two-component system, NarL family, nitrate/nitrite response regulator NarL